MTERIIIAGAGGQGIMLLGKVLVEAAMREAKFVTWLPCYGAEVRGGTAYCMVVISDEEIGSPYIAQADTLIIMNDPSWRRFKGRAKNKKSCLIINSSLVNADINTQAQLLKHPFTEIAIKLGNIRVANIVALGCFVRQRKIVAAESVVRAIEEIAPCDKKALIEINKKALSAGMELVKPNN